MYVSEWVTEGPTLLLEPFTYCWLSLDYYTAIL